MIMSIPLQQVPNQSLNVQPDTQSLQIDVYLQGELMYADVYINNTLIIAGYKCLGGTNVNQYNTPLKGYLFWYTINHRNPYYTDFGVNSFLLWSDLNLQELAYLKYVRDHKKELGF